MATFGYKVMENLYSMSDEFDLGGSILLGELANYADQIDKILTHDDVTRTEEETQEAFKKALDTYTDSYGKNMELDEDTLTSIHEVIAMSVEV